jgi:hypothetical protein
VDDRARTGLDHGRHQGTFESNRAEQVQLQLVEPVLVGQGRESACGR